MAEKNHGGCINDPIWGTPSDPCATALRSRLGL